MSGIPPNVSARGFSRDGGRGGAETMNTTFARGLHREQTQTATDLTDGQPLGQALTHQQKLHGGLGEACPSLTPFPPARSSHRGDKFSPPRVDGNFRGGAKATGRKPCLRGSVLSFSSRFSLLHSGNF